jgi:hypothetical protein
MTIDAQKVVAAIQARIANSLAYAGTRAGGFGSGELLVYQAGGYKTPEEYCRAEDATYQLCQELLAAGQ